MAEFENRLACVIKADGAIARGYMIETCEFDGVNEYVITWKNPLQGAVKTNFSGTIGSALDEPVLPGLITVGRQRIHRRRGCRPLIPAESPLHVLSHRLLSRSIMRCLVGASLRNRELERK
jgi:hypothetical protein